MTPGALAAVRARIATPERFQMLHEDRLWADLLSSMPLCFNLFGELAGTGDGESEPARRAVRAWWPDAPGGNVRVRFEHSPGRRDPAFLGNKSAFDVAFDIDAGNGSSAIVGVETKYHEHAVAEKEPKPAALARYVEVTERSRMFAEGWRERVIGTDLQQIWLDHLLVLAMLQHPSQRWVRGRSTSRSAPSEPPESPGAPAERAACLRPQRARDGSPERSAPRVRGADLGGRKRAVVARRVAEIVAGFGKDADRHGP
jgi:hypothetical protein